MKKKILFCATVDFHFTTFHTPFLKYFKECGWETHVAAAGNSKIPYVDKQFNIPFSRKPFSKNNIKAYLSLRKIMREAKYDIVHFHIPVSATLGRIAAQKYRKRGTKVIYTSHGHYYYKGGPLLSWILYFPIEKILARYTDCLITINEEDYQLSIKKQRGPRVFNKIHGMGVDLNRFKPISDEQKIIMRKNFGLSPSSFILIYPAELNRNKNQLFLLEVIDRLKTKVPNILLLLVGKGEMFDAYTSIIEQYDISRYVRLLGYRKDVNELIMLSDVSVASSLREGLGINIVEGMACGKPVVAIKNRGHTELVKHGMNGFLVESNNSEQFADYLYLLFSKPELRKELGENSLKFVGKYSLDSVKIEMENIYKKFQ